nr:hypothetical protein [Tanacetum cinerariifolium]
TNTKELEKLKRQEKEANDVVESLWKEATHGIQNASTSSTNLINTASTPLSTAGPSRAFNDGELSYPNPSNYALPDAPSMPHLKDIYASPSEEIFTDSSYDDEGMVTDFNNLEITMSVSPIPTTRIHTIHPKTQILGDPKSAVQTWSKVNKNSKAYALVKQKEDGIFISQDKYVAKILKKFNFLSVKAASTPIETQKPLVNDEEAADVDVHLYRFQVTPNTSHLHDVKKIFRYLKGQPKLVLWYPKMSSFDLEAYSDSDYAGANLDRKFTTGELASLTQMALGKDISNSLMAGRLPKTTLPTSALVLKQPLGMNLAALWHQQSFVLLQIRSLTSQADMSHHKDIYDNPSLTKKVFANMKRVGTGFSRVVTPLFHNMLVLAAKEVGLIQDDVQLISIPIEPSITKPYKKQKPKKQQTQASKVPSPEPSPEHRLPLPSNDPRPGGKDSLKLKELMDLCTHLFNKVLELESKVIDIKSTYKERIEKLKGRVDKLEEEKRVLKELHSVHSKVDTVAPIAKPYRMDLEHPEKVLSMQDVDDEEPAKVEEVLEVVTVAKLITKVVTTVGVTTTAEATKVNVLRRRRGVVIQDPEETTSIVVVHSEVQSKDKGKVVLIKEPKSLKGQAQIEQDEAFSRQLEAELNADINWNAVIDEIIPLFEKHYNYNQAFLEEVSEEVTIPEKEVEVEGHKREGESLEKEITKKQNMDEKAEELKSHLQIVSNDDDDVYTEATLELKIPIVDYKIHLERNKPYFKIIRADGNHMLFLSFSTLLKNFDRENLMSLWKLVKESVWRDQKGKYRLAKRYPLTHFTLEQMLNSVRLDVEEESEMSLELLRLVRRQLNEGGGLLGIIDFNILLLLFILSVDAWNYCWHS